MDRRNSFSAWSIIKSAHFGEKDGCSERMQPFQSWFQYVSTTILIISTRFSSVGFWFLSVLDLRFTDVQLYILLHFTRGKNESTPSADANSIYFLVSGSLSSILANLCETQYNPKTNFFEEGAKRQHTCFWKRKIPERVISRLETYRSYTDHKLLCRRNSERSAQTIVL